MKPTDFNIILEMEIDKIKKHCFKNGCIPLVVICADAANNSVMSVINNPQISKRGVIDLLNGMSNQMQNQKIIS